MKDRQNIIKSASTKIFQMISAIIIYCIVGMQLKLQHITATNGMHVKLYDVILTTYFVSTTKSKIKLHDLNNIITAIHAVIS